MSRTTLAVALLAATLATSPLRAAEIIGSYLVDAPQSASLITPGDGPASEVWFTVHGMPVDWAMAFSGPGITDDGIAYLRDNCIVEVEFAADLLVNRPGPDLLLIEARWNDGSYALSSDYDDFATEITLPSTAFAYTGRSRFYYRGSALEGPYPAGIYAAPVDLSNLGVPLGATVSEVRFRTSGAGWSPLGLGAIVPEPATAAMLLGVLLMRRRTS